MLVVFVVSLSAAGKYWRKRCRFKEAYCLDLTAALSLQSRYLSSSSSFSQKLPLSAQSLVIFFI